MLHAPTRPRATRLPTLLALCALALLAPAAAAAQAGAAADKPREEPPFSAYKGVRIGMTADEARKLLGSPTEKDDKQDVYAFDEQESCEVYYDAAKKVSAVKVTFLGGKATAPTARAVLGDEPQANQDGSVYKLVRFPKAGFWVSYTRTSSDAPMTIIAIQKIQQ
ncbi:MAG TPA: hypothetical protein VF668_22020 [Pyrinomonadaceae bacterium]|jgi:outer membrane protein assembly factor BamE (lipoprotein component of BamABCDE complex)